MKYSLTIGRYNRHIRFDTLDELINELKQYFTAREIASGIIDRLTRFTMKTITENGFSYKHGENKHQDLTINCYEF